MQARGELLTEALETFSVTDLDIRRARALPVALAHYLRRRRPNALLVAMWPLTVIAPFSRIFSGHNFRLLLSEHNLLSSQYASWGPSHHLALQSSMAIGYRMADARVAVSAGVASDMSTLSKMKPDAFNIINNPISPNLTPLFSDLQRAESLWRTPAGSRIIHVGRFKPVKNHTLLLRSFAQLKDNRARLMLLGEGQDEMDLRLLADTLGISERVIFAGFKADLAPFYMTADLLVLSSDNEGFGNVLIEALSFGLPVVSTNCPSGPTEILENGRWGTLVPVNDVERMTEAIEASLRNSVDSDELKKRAADFAPDIVARKYLSLLGLE